MCIRDSVPPPQGTDEFGNLQLPLLNPVRDATLAYGDYNNGASFRPSMPPVPRHRWKRRSACAGRDVYKRQVEYHPLITPRVGNQAVIFDVDGVLTTPGGDDLLRRRLREH